MCLSQRLRTHTFLVTRSPKDKCCNNSCAWAHTLFGNSCALTNTNNTQHTHVMKYLHVCRQTQCTHAPKEAATKEIKVHQSYRKTQVAPPEPLCFVKCQNTYFEHMFIIFIDVNCFSSVFIKFIVFIDFYWFLMVFVGFRSLLLVFIDFYWFSLIFIDFHWFLLIFIDSSWLLLTFLDFHGF